MNDAARKIRPKKNMHSFRGKKFSEKNGAMIHWESLLEKDFIKVLEFDSTIISYESQPIEINYIHNNKEKKYYPDFKAITNTNEIFLYEVKPSEKINDEKNMEKFEAARLFCKENHWNFKIVTEKDIRKGFFIENLDFLKNYIGIRTTPSIIKYLSDLIDTRGTCSILELKLIFLQKKNMDISHFYMNLYYMISKNLIKVDLVSCQINDQTLLSK